MLRVAVLVFLATVAVSGTREHEEAFLAFKAKFSRVYASPAEEARRFNVFCDRLQEIEKLNKETPGGYGITQFTDRTEVEMKSFLLPADESSKRRPERRVAEASRRLPSACRGRPTSYRTPYVTQVKQMGDCNSCYAFAYMALLEAEYGKLINRRRAPGNVTLPPSFSVQQIVSCYAEDCGPQNAFNCGQWMEQRKLYTDKAYPYTSFAGGEVDDCIPNSELTGIWYRPGDLKDSATCYDDRWKDATLQISKSEAVLMHIQVCPGLLNWNSTQLYSCKCEEPYDTLHVLAAIGYNVTQDGTRYYIVKNSWGLHWGDRGYFYLEDGTCDMYQRILTGKYFT